MISVETYDHDLTGLADLGDAIELAKTQGISNASGAMNEIFLNGFDAVSDAARAGVLKTLPGVIVDTRGNGVNVAGFYAPAAKDTLLGDSFESIEHRITETAGEDLPRWNPTRSMVGTRIITLLDGSIFPSHTDIYEGIVAAAQVDVSGKKKLHAYLNGKWVDEEVKTGDITFFAGDSFGDAERILHSFSFAGLSAVSLTIGQDPDYTISGNRPFYEENPNAYR